MKRPPSVTACVVDYGSFTSLAEKLGETFAKTYYYSPFEAEYLDIIPCLRGTGLENVERTDDYLSPDILKEVDLYVFPDRGYGGVQAHLREMGKAVWGSFDMSAMEEYRTLFTYLLQRLGMPMVESVEIEGVTALADHLKDVEDKWVKIDRYRQVMETWHHKDLPHSQRELERLAKAFGPAKEQIKFIVQDAIETEVEIGYDGWSVDGMFPSISFQGYEAKNELYLGHLLPTAQLPEEVRYVNNKLAPILKGYGYRNFWSTEIRVLDGVPYFIDPTPRMPGQTGEQLLETCHNLAEVIWYGANGELIQPAFDYEFAVEATLHYTAGAAKDWKALRIPTAADQWVKLYNYCRIDGMMHMLPNERTDEVGVVLGVGDTAQEALEHLQENLEALKEEPLHADVRDFAGLLEKIEAAEEQGVHFSDEPLPEASAVL